MKKTISYALVLLVLVTGMAFGAPVVAGTEGGSELTFGVITGQDGTKLRWTNLVWTNVVQVNESNYILFGIKGNGNTNLSDFSLKAFSGNMILDKVFALPEGTSLKLKFGFDDVAATNAPPSGYAYESVMGYDPGARATLALLGKMGAINFKAAIDPEMDYVAFGNPVAKSAILANVYGNAGPFFLSAAYYSNGKAFDGGKLGGEVAYNGTAGIFGLGIDTEYSMDFSNGEGILGIAGVASVGWLSLDASTNLTKETDTNTMGFNALGFGVEARPDKQSRYGASLGIDLNMNPKVTETIKSVDGSVWFKALGPGKLRVGYLYTMTGNGAGDYYAPASLQNGGAYIKYDMSW